MASTNKTTNYDLSQYIGTDKPTYLTDYNQDMSKIDTGIHAAKSEADTNTLAIGTLSNLTTTAKTNLVAAINEVKGETQSIGVLTDLTTTAKTSVVAAINEVNGKTSDIGALTDLTTTAKTSVVAAVNEVNANVGVLANLTTTAKTNLVSAVNEVNSNIGSLSSLTTTDKTSVVAAINSVEEKIDELDNYSTTESLTGQKWIDNSPIYRKVLSIGSVNAGSTVAIATGITNINHVIYINGFGYDASDDWFPLNRPHPSSGQYVSTFYYNKNDNTIAIETGSSMAFASGYVIIEYTKTQA